MSQKKLGNTGVLIPEVGLGTWNYQSGPEPLKAGFEVGAVFVDTAESYGTESVVGEALRLFGKKVFVATKVSPQNFRPTDLRKAVERSLQQLGLDVIDLLQLHQPNDGVPIEETMGELANCIDRGKVRFAGVSNFSVVQLQAAQRAFGSHRIVSNQVRYNLIDRTIEKDGVMEYCRANGVTIIAYSPLAREFGRIADCDSDGVLKQLARETGRSRAQVAINWCLSGDGVVAIPKGNSEPHILDNCGAAGWRLTPEQMALLDSRIQFRHRNRFDALLRQYTPRPLRQVALHALRALPAWLRRRVS